MIFKHEFLITNEEKNASDTERLIRSRRERCVCELAKKIEETFGLEEMEKPPHWPPEDTRQKLEIVAFTMKDWAMFRQRLNHFFPNRDIDTLLFDLEYGNPLITNPK